MKIYFFKLINMDYYNALPINYVQSLLYHICTFKAIRYAYIYISIYHDK